MGGIVWLASYPKSGNTWTRIFLENLMTDSKQGGADINALSLMRFNDSAPGPFEQASGRPPGDLSEEEIANLRPRVQAAIAAASTDSVFVKTHCALLSDFGVPQIAMNLTSAAIYILRNPLDVAVSYASYFDVPQDAAIELMGSPLAISPTQKDVRTGKYVSMYALLGSWSEHVLSWTRAENPGLLILRYEDLVQEPVKTFGRLATFLGLSPGRARLERAVKASSFHRLRRQERERGFREGSGQQMFRSGKAGRWREALTEAQIGKILDDHREQMARFGYLPVD